MGYRVNGSAVFLESAAVLGRAMVLPLVLGLRWTAASRRLPIGRSSSVGNPVSLGARVALDELFVAAEVLGGHSLAIFDQRRIHSELKEALGLYARRGWLVDPAKFHPAPPPLVVRSSKASSERGLNFEELTYESGYAPFEGEPGRDRWISYEENRTGYARLFRHRDGNRPWIVCVPGYRMGETVVDSVGFRVRWLYEELGFNVAIPVLPFHGPRQVGRRTGDGYLTGDFVDTIHAQAQAVWDVRSLLRWLEGEQAPGIGLYGVSLGAYTAAMVASLESELDCVVAGVPAVDLPDLIFANVPAPLVWLSQMGGFPWKDVDDASRVISPLALPRAVPRDRCFLFAGDADALVPPAHARDLWEHWDRPRLQWYPGGHVSFVWEQEVENLLLEAFSKTGLLAAEARPSLRLVS